MGSQATPTSRPPRPLERVEGTGSAAQHARRRQIMRVALRLVIERGYDGFQMREVADTAKVSTRTLYKHFPSKEHLVLAATVDQGETINAFFGSGHQGGRTPASRVRRTLARPTQALQAVPALTTGMAKALVSGQASIAPILIEFRDLMIDAIARAIRPTGPTDDDLAIARILQRVWFAAVLAWSSGIEPPESVDKAIDEAIERLLSRPAALQARQHQASERWGRDD